MVISVYLARKFSSGWSLRVGKTSGPSSTAKTQENGEVAKIVWGDRRLNIRAISELTTSIRNVLDFARRSGPEKDVC